MRTKLCARGGCTAPADGKYCSRRCSAIARLCAGWTPHAVLLRPDVRQRGSRLGALACAVTRRRQRAKAIQARLGHLLKHPAFQGMEPEQLAAVAATQAKAYRIGKADGYQRGWHAKQTPRTARVSQKEAARIVWADKSKVILKDISQ